MKRVGFGRIVTTTHIEGQARSEWRTYTLLRNIGARPTRRRVLWPQVAGATSQTNKVKIVASYHLSAQPVKRSEGRSVVAMAAYRAGCLLQDRRRGVVIDFRRRRGVAHAEILSPPGSAGWLTDREQLWNYVERIERRVDAQLAREINMALPHELTDAERLDLVRGFVKEQFVAKGMVADIALHRPVPEKGDDPRNFHAHVLLTLRQAQADGLRAVKTREWNSDSMLLAWRAAWAEHQNRALQRSGHKDRVDHRSFAARKVEAERTGEWVEARRLDRVPEVHVGPMTRKASRWVEPESRDKFVGPNRKARSGRRALRYTTIDRGSRAAENIRRLTSNVKAMRVDLEKVERHLVVLRKHLRRYERAIRERRSQSQHAQEQSNRASALLHARLRRRQVLWLIEQLDLLFADLLGIREAQLMRRTVWRNRLGRSRQFDFSELPGGGRRRFLDRLEESARSHSFPTNTNAARSDS